MAVALIFLSVISYFLLLFIENLPALKIDYVLGVFSYIMSNPMSYFSFILLVLIVYMMEKIFDYIGEENDKKKEGKFNVQEIPYDPLLGTKDDRESFTGEMRRQDRQDEKYTGYAYSEENNPNPNLL